MALGIAGTGLGLGLAGCADQGNQGAGASSAATPASAQEPQDGFATDVVPPAVRPVVIVSGTPYEMGVQYGKACADYIQRNATAIEASALPIWGSKEAIVERLDEFEKIMSEKTPDAVEMWKGIAEGSGVDYDGVRLINLNLPILIMPPEEGDVAGTQTCSHFSAWGDATADGKMIAGNNLDQGWNVGACTCVVVGYPKDGNSFIVCPPWAGQAGGGFALNDKGLGLTGSGGMGSRPEDSTFSVDSMAAKFDIIMHYDNAADAKDRFLEHMPASAENAQFLDPQQAYIVEYTPAVQAVRQAGDHGEKDYLIATNYFIDEKAAEANYKDEWMGGLWDSIPRYQSYEQLIKENYGKIDEPYAEEMLGCTKYWDGTQWITDTLQEEPFEDPKDLWSPEGRSVQYKTLFSNIMIPDERKVFLMQGQSDDLLSAIPEAPGVFCTITLEDSPAAVAETAYAEAEYRIWLAGKALREQQEEPSEEEREKLDQARRAIWLGFNDLNVAGSSDDSTEALSSYGQAVTHFCEAQTFAAQLLKGRE
ncbi:C45 family autoproteolytic acyltransferase/hydolase [Adlercreutzia mucosicola]|uniref:C45 family autoproteolytic acyltransferase/hydolase n=1 Tax=Adlercreutzia mucosicola TaxID=580026 RepID=UPI000480E27F|nr:C45 family peptidase [Adlercreutzia mucosicola]MCR2035463.1 C45 family autoproteolytic acyltransferase/hydrolase [Adlercreutzia mucosicola]